MKNVFNPSKLHPQFYCAPFQQLFAKIKTNIKFVPIFRSKCEDFLISVFVAESNGRIKQALKLSGSCYQNQNHSEEVKMLHRAFDLHNFQ